MKIKNIFKIAFFVFIFILLFVYFTIRYVPESFEDQTWSTTATYRGFYKMDRNTIDVLFLGNSAGSRGYIPQKLYDDYKIKSYNLCCEQQNMISSYYWLKEALKYQKPKVVVLESKFVFEDDDFRLVDANFRKAFDSMRFSNNKKEAIDVICSLPDSEDKLSWYVPLIRYHSRWEETGKPEGLNYYLQMKDKHDNKGFCPAYAFAEEKYEPLDLDSTNEEAVTSDIEVAYLRKIVKECKDNDIALILTVLPCTLDTVEAYNFLNNFAEQNKLVFLDFNTPEIISDMNYSFNEDSEMSTHANLWGAIKITDYIGNYLYKNYKFNIKIDNQWENTHEDYIKLIEEYNILKTEGAIEDAV